MSQSDLYEILAIFLVFAVTLLVIGIVCNPMFWQGYRNSKFLDELKQSKNKSKKAKKKFDKNWLKP